VTTDDPPRPERVARAGRTHQPLSSQRGHPIVAHRRLWSSMKANRIAAGETFTTGRILVVLIGDDTVEIF
jgi:hypothetical protein